MGVSGPLQHPRLRPWGELMIRCLGSHMQISWLSLKEDQMVICIFETSVNTINVDFTIGIRPVHAGDNPFNYYKRQYGKPKCSD
jgi:hypothetical protein